MRAWFVLNYLAASVDASEFTSSAAGRGKRRLYETSPSSRFPYRCPA